MSTKHNTRHPAEPSQDRSPIENTLSLGRLTDKQHGKDDFTNKDPLRCPPWARGAYGGQIIAQSLLAAYETVPANFKVHSIHCHFLNAVNVDLSVIYHVERVRDGKSFASRVVQARQHDRLAFSATASFVRDDKRRNVLQHAVPMPRGERPPGDDNGNIEPADQSPAGQAGQGQPCDCIRVPKKYNAAPSEQRLRHWVRARGQIGDAPLDPCCNLDTSTPSSGERDNHHAHAVALAYMTDNYFIGTAFRVHNASRFSNRSSADPMLSRITGSDPKNTESLQEYLDALAWEEKGDNKYEPESDKLVDMVATLDHAIYFHHPRDFRADEWLLVETESPWADDERGLVVARIWSHDGTLVATCIQEGVVRLSQHCSTSRL